MPEKATLRVGAAQINCELAKLPNNVQRHRNIIQDAGKQHLDLLVFPELSLTGYGLKQATMDVALPRDAPLLLDLAGEAGDTQVVVGFVEEAGPGEYYNALAVLQAGQVVAVHRKVNLPTYGGLEEGKWFTPGNSLTETEISPGWPASHLICADLWNPALVHQAMMRRPSILCAPINSATGIVSQAFSNEDNWLLNARFYAMTYGTPVILVNRYGPEGDSLFWGGSRILGPRGEDLAVARDAEALIHTEIHYRDIARARFELPTHRDAQRTANLLEDR